MIGRYFPYRLKIGAAKLEESTICMHITMEAIFDGYSKLKKNTGRIGISNRNSTFPASIAF